MPSVWARIFTRDSVNLQDAESKEVANDLRAEENEQYIDTSEEEFVIPTQPSEDAVHNEMSKSDSAIAKILQQQFDAEHEEILKRFEQRFSSALNISIPFTNYRRVPPSFDCESDAEQEIWEGVRDGEDWDQLDILERKIAATSPCRYKSNKGCGMITKYNVTMDRKLNVCKKLDSKLCNKDFNSSQVHHKYKQAKRRKLHQQVRRCKLLDKKGDHVAAEFGVDQYTGFLLDKMINSQLLVRVKGLICTGKESIVLHAETNSNCSKHTIPNKCCIKVFTAATQCKKRERYIDCHFKSGLGPKPSSRRIAHLWAEREMCNLIRLQKAGVPCPKVLALQKHILIMSFIGDKTKAAPELRSLKFEPGNVNYILAYEQVVEYMKMMFAKANLIHGDLSENNILWHNETCVFIDVSQSVEPTHENAFDFLIRDCVNMSNFFIQKGVPDVLSGYELFKEITGCLYADIETLQLQESVQMKQHLVDSLT